MRLSAEQTHKVNAIHEQTNVIQIIFAQSFNCYWNFIVVQKFLPSKITVNHMTQCIEWNNTIYKFKTKKALEGVFSWDSEELWNIAKERKVLYAQKQG